MAFPIRKNTSVGVGAQSTIDIFVARKLRNFGLRTAQNELNIEQKQNIQQVINNLKNQIYGFVAELQKLVASAGNNPSISIDYIGSFDDVFDLAKEAEEFRDYLPQLGVDPENLDLALDIMESVAIDGIIANSKSRRADINLTNDQQLIEALSSLMEMVVVDEEDYPLTDFDQYIPDIGADKGLIEALINGTPEERAKILAKYGLDEQKFNNILIENGYLKTSKIESATERHLIEGYKNFVEGAIRQAGGKKVEIDQVGFDVPEFISLLRKSKQESLGSKGGENGVVLQDLTGTDFFLRYFFPSRNLFQKELSPALSAMVSDLAYSAGTTGSIVRNVSQPYSQDEVSDVHKFFDNFKTQSTPEAIQLTQRIEQTRAMLEKAPPPLRPQIEKQIANYEQQLSQMTSNKSDFTSNLEFPKMKPSDSSGIAKGKAVASQSFESYKRNPNDLGSLGLALEEYIKLYNISSSKTPEEANRLSKAQEKLIGSTWFRFISPAYRYLNSCDEFIRLIGSPRSGVDRDAPKEELLQQFARLQEKYIDITKSQNSSESIDNMKDFEYIASEFAGSANLSISSSSKQSKAMKVAAEIFKFLHLIRINIQNPESVIVFRSMDKNKEQGQVTANANMSGFTIVPTYRIG